MIGQDYISGTNNYVRKGVRIYGTLRVFNNYPTLPKLSFGRRELNEMKTNEKNNFRIFFSSLIWEF